MDNLSLPERDADARLVQYLMAQHGTPAFARRALRIQEAIDQLHERCRKQREQWLGEGRTLLEDLASLLPGWEALAPVLTSFQHVELFPFLQAALGARASFRDVSFSARRVRSRLARFVGWTQHFNVRWHAFLLTQDLAALNELREGYNRWYVIEKECALRSARLARHGFEPMPPYSIQDLLTAFPLLPVPE